MADKVRICFWTSIFVIHESTSILLYLNAYGQPRYFLLLNLNAHSQSIQNLLLGLTFLWVSELILWVVCSMCSTWNFTLGCWNLYVVRLNLYFCMFELFLCVGELILWVYQGPHAGRPLGGSGATAAPSQQLWHLAGPLVRRAQAANISRGGTLTSMNRWQRPLWCRVMQ